MVILGQAASGVAARFYTTWRVVVIVAVTGTVVLGISLSRRPEAGSPDREQAGHVAVP